MALAGDRQPIHFPCLVPPKLPVARETRTRAQLASSNQYAADAGLLCFALVAQGLPNELSANVKRTDWKRREGKKEN